MAMIGISLFCLRIEFRLLFTFTGGFHERVLSSNARLALLVLVSITITDALIYLVIQMGNGLATRLGGSVEPMLVEVRRQAQIL